MHQQQIIQGYCEKLNTPPNQSVMSHQYEKENKFNKKNVLILRYFSLK